MPKTKQVQINVHLLCLKQSKYTLMSIYYASNKNTG